MRRLSLVGILALVACPAPPVTQEPVVAGLTSLARFDEVAPGAECEHGGVRVLVGLDRDGDGKLSDEEAQDSALLCHGAPGATRPADLMRLQPGVFATCDERPGLLVEIGRDANQNLVLDPEEVRQSGHVCDGAPGAYGGDALVEVVDAEVCPHGGQRVRAGLDGDGDGQLGAAEVLLEREVCHGAPSPDQGEQGTPAQEVLVKLEEPLTECAPVSGVRVSFGVDLDGSGELSTGEASEIIVLCDGIEGQGAPLGPGGGLDEGSELEPVEVAVTAFGDLLAGHQGGVAAHGTSHYAFTTRDDHGLMPYTVALFGAAGAPAVLLSEADGGAAVEVSCAAEVLAGELARVCRTAPLAPAAGHRVVVRDTRNIGSAYVLTLSAGANEGGAGEPLEIDAGDLEAGDLVFRGSVRERGVSTYGFAVPRRDHYTITMEDRDEPEGDAELSFSLYRGEVRDDRRLLRCVSGSCLTPRLEESEEVVLQVEAGRGRPAGFALRVSPGDTLHPEVPFDEVAPFASPLHFTVPASGSYSVWLSEAQHFGLYDDALAEVPFVHCLAYWHTSCLVELEGPARYYLRGLTFSSPFPHEVLVTPNTGQEGSLDAPLALELGAARRGSTAQGYQGDYGPEAAESFYRFTTDEAGPYVIHLDGEQPGRPDVFSVSLFTDPFFTQGVTVRDTRATRALRSFVSLPLAAETTHYFKVRSYDAMTFAVRVEPGDGGIPTLPLDDTAVGVSLAAASSTWFTFSAAALSLLQLSVAGITGEVTLRLYRGLPAGPLVRSLRLTADGALVDAAQQPLRLTADSYYLEVRATSNFSSEDVDLTASLIAPEVLALGVPFRREGVPPNGSHWYRVDVPVEGAYTMTVAADTSEGGATGGWFRVYRPDDTLDSTGLWSGSTLNRALASSPPAAVGSWLIKLENRNADLPWTYDVTVSGP